MKALELKIGDTYPIADWYGMLGMDGTYVGIVRDEANFGPEILVFSFVPGWNDAPPIRYAGCVAEAYIRKGYDKPDGVGITLHAHYYGDSIETLKHVNDTKKPHHWEIRKNT